MHGLCGIPVPQTVDMQVDACSATELVPVGQKGGVVIRLAPRREKEGVEVCELLQAARPPIQARTVGIRVLPQHLGGLGRKADDLDPPPSTALAEGGRFL